MTSSKIRAAETILRFEELKMKTKNKKTNAVHRQRKGTERKFKALKYSQYKHTRQIGVVNQLLRIEDDYNVACCWFGSALSLYSLQQLHCIIHSFSVCCKQ